MINSGVMTVLSTENAYPPLAARRPDTGITEQQPAKSKHARSPSANRRTVVDTPFDKSELRLSPDGRQIAYASLETGRSEVYVASLPDFGEKRQVSSGGGLHPVWRKDGKELFFLGPNRKLMAAEIKPGTAVEVEAAKPLFSVVIAGLGSQFDVTADGKRFLCDELPLIESEQLSVVLNWPAELKR